MISILKRLQRIKIELEEVCADSFDKELTSQSNEMLAKAEHDLCSALCWIDIIVQLEKGRLDKGLD